MTGYKAIFSVTGIIVGFNQAIKIANYFITDYFFARISRDYYVIII